MFSLVVSKICKRRETYMHTYHNTSVHNAAGDKATCSDNLQCRRARIVQLIVFAR